MNYFLATCTFTGDGLTASKGELICTDKEVREQLATPLECRTDDDGKVTGYFEGDQMRFDANKVSTAKAAPFVAQTADAQRAQANQLASEKAANEQLARENAELKAQLEAANKAKQDPANKSK